MTYLWISYDIIWLVVYRPTPLKNDGLRQLGWLLMIIFPTEWKVIKKKQYINHIFPYVNHIFMINRQKIPWFLFHQALFPGSPTPRWWAVTSDPSPEVTEPSSRWWPQEVPGNLRRKWRSVWNKNHELNNGKHGKHIGQSWKIISK